MDRAEISELLSAYLDGEVSPAERAEVERSLEASPELRDELNELARLSDLVRALPRETAPAELADAIRQSAEHKSLWGSSTAAPKRSLRREWLAAFSGMAVTAAAWFVTVQTLDMAPARQADIGFNTPAMETAENTGQFPRSVVTAQEAEHDLVAMRDEPGRRELLKSMPMSADGITRKMAAPAADQPPPAAAPAASMAAAKSAPLGDKLPEGDAGFGGLVGGGLGGVGMGAERLEGLVSIGDVLPYWERTNDGIAVVELTVVNIDEAGGQLEVLLQKNGLQFLADQNSKLARADKQAQASDDRSADANQLMVVYVDAPRETIAQMLDEMVQERLFSRAKLQPPLDAPVVALNDGQNAVGGNRDRYSKESPETETEQLVEEVVGLSQSYIANRLANSNPAPSEQAANSIVTQQNLKNQRASRHGSFESRSQDRRAGKDAQRRALSTQGFKKIDDEPVDAETALSANLPGSNYFRSQRNTAVAVELNSATGELTNSLPQQNFAVNSAREAKQGNLLEKAKPGKALAEDAKADHDGDRVETEVEPISEPTIRVLFVLQTTGSAETP